MKIEEPEAMAEIHRIREKIYYEMKSMTPEEKRAFVRNTAEKVLKDHNIVLKQKQGSD